MLTRHCSQALLAGLTLDRLVVFSTHIISDMGCAGWGDQARRELRASGESSVRRNPIAVQQLTAQELQISSPRWGYQTEKSASDCISRTARSERTCTTSSPSSASPVAGNLPRRSPRARHDTDRGRRIVAIGVRPQLTQRERKVLEAHLRGRQNRNAESGCTRPTSESSPRRPSPVAYATCLQLLAPASTRSEGRPTSRRINCGRQPSDDLLQQYDCNRSPTQRIWIPQQVRQQPR